MDGTEDLLKSTGDIVSACLCNTALQVDQIAGPTSLEDGRKMKSLKRHLTIHGLTPE